MTHLRRGADPQVHVHKNEVRTATAVSWLKLRLTKTRPKEPWTESVEECKTRLKLCAAQINQKYDVDGLCRALPKRLKMLEEREGDRISK